MPTGEQRQRNATMPHRYETSMIFSSENADQLDLRGSRFTVNFGGDKLSIPKNAENILLQVEQAQVWNTVPNITEDNNILTFTLNGVNQTIEIAKGLYSRPQLNLAVQRSLENAGLIQNNQTPFQILEDSSVNRVVLLINDPTLVLDFTAPRNFAIILGFQDQVVGPISNTPQNITAPEIARFNTVEFFLIGSNLVDRGIRVNNRYANVITTVPIDVPAGGNIIYEPRNPARVDCSNLRGSIEDRVSFYLTDQNLKPVDTNGEFFSVRIMLSYTA